MHVYAFLKTRSALNLSAKSGIPLAAYMAVMVFSPFIVHYSEDLGFAFIARLVSYVGYTWMGMLFLFLSLTFCIDMYRLLIGLFSLILQRDLSHASITTNVAFFLSILFAVSVSFYGYLEAMDIHTEHVMIRTPKIPAGVGKIRIVQISDVHLGLIVRESRLRKIVKAVKKAKPDVLVSTGDLVDGQINRLAGFSEILREINPRYGKFAITGNHEFYAGIDQALDFTKNAGFTILRGSSVDVKGIITIAGVDDRTGRIYDRFKDISEKELLAGSHEKFTLLLKHRPLVDNGASGRFDLQLSGHTHKGQIFPFSLFTQLYYPQDAGYAGLSNNSHLYVSRGTGTWGPPIRFLSPPEVTVIELVRQEQ